MLSAGFSKRQIVLTVALIVPLGLSSAYAVSNHGKSNAALQALADDAALAGINSLAANVGLPDEKRIEASVAAAKKVISAAPDALHAISTSVDRLALSVVLDDPQSGTRVSSTARYIPPSDGISSQQAATVPERKTSTGLRRYAFELSKTSSR
jgi:hypothetical protein